MFFHFGNEKKKGKHILLTSKRYKLKLFYNGQCLKYVNISQEILSKKNKYMTGSKFIHIFKKSIKKKKTD